MMKMLFSKEEIEFLRCHHCGKYLLNPPNGHLVIKSEWEDNQQIISDFRWVCKSCDHLYRYPHEHWNWKDLPDLFIPDVLVQWILGIMVGLHTKTETFSDEAMEKTMKLLLILFPHISKKITTQQEKTLKTLYEIPRFLGGLG